MTHDLTYPINLLHRVTAVNVETMSIARSLPPLSDLS